MFSTIYSNVYNTFEIPGTKIYFAKDIRHGLVELSDGAGLTRKARLELSRDSLSVQLPHSYNYGGHMQHEFEGDDPGLRYATIHRQPDGGLGLSIKGGTEESCKLPVVVSKIFKPELLPELVVGDIIVEVNGVNIDDYAHDEVVALMREADTVVLGVKHDRTITPFMGTPSSTRRGVDQGSTLDRTSEAGYYRGSSIARSDVSSMNTLRTAQDEAPKGWETYAKLALPMAYITRYLWGTDKIRPNGFEVRAVDGSTSGIILCEEVSVLEEWVAFITANIQSLNNRTVKMSNKYLHPNDLIVYLGWVCEKQSHCKEFWQNWESLFLILKGSDVCFFKSPPLNSNDMNKCSHTYRIYETALKILKEADLQDDRENCCLLETATGTKHYLSMESFEELRQMEAAWQRATYYAVQRIESKSFACNFDGRPSALTLDFNSGFALYDIHTKTYPWRYPFAYLKGSSDDGRMRMQFQFRRRRRRSTSQLRNMSLDRFADSKKLETQNIDCIHLYPLLFTVHAFMLAKLVSVDPDFLAGNENI